MLFYWKEVFYKGGCNYPPPWGICVKNNVGVRRVNIFTILVTVQPFLLYWGPRSLVEKWYPEGSIKSSSSYFPGILWRANIKSSIAPVSSTCFWQETLFTTHLEEGLMKLAQRNFYCSSQFYMFLTRKSFYNTFRKRTHKVSTNKLGQLG